MHQNTEKQHWVSVLLKLQERGVPERIGWPGSLQSRNTVSPVPHVSQQKKKIHAADRVSGPAARLPATMESDEEVSCGRMPAPEVFIGARTWKGLPCAGGGRWWAIYSNITRHLLPHAKLFFQLQHEMWMLLDFALRSFPASGTKPQPAALVGVTIRSPDPSELLNVGKVAQ